MDKKTQNTIVLLGSKVALNNGRTDSRLTFKHVSLQENHLVIYLGVLYFLCSRNKINKKGKKITGSESPLTAGPKLKASPDLLFSGSF